MRKKGISPIIATVLIIGFVIAVAAILVTWGIGFTKKQTEGVDKGVVGISLVGSVSLELKSVKIFPNHRAQLTVENTGKTDISNVVARFFDETKNVDAVPTDGGIPAYSIENFIVNYDNTFSGITKVEVFPQVLAEGENVSLPEVSNYKNIVLKECSESADCGPGGACYIDIGKCVIEECSCPWDEIPECPGILCGCPDPLCNEGTCKNPDDLLDPAHSSCYGGIDITNPSCTLEASLPPDGLVNWWKADGDATDFESGNDGELKGGGATFAEGIVGQAFSLAGNSYVDFANVNSPSGPHTVEAWIKYDGDSWKDFNTIINFGYYKPLFTIGIARHDPNHYLKIYWEPRNGGAGDAFILINEWMHVAYTFDDENEYIKLYLNGDEVGLVYGSPPTSGRGMTIGSSLAGESWTGLIDEVRIYNRALTAEEITIVSAEPGCSKDTNCIDNDGDGYIEYNEFTCPSGNDCNGLKPDINPSATEICGDGVDNDCDGSIDEGIAPTGLISWWDGEGNANDVIGIHHGSWFGTESYVDGKVGQAFSFYGYNYVNVESLDTPEGPHTVEAWIKYDDGTSLMDDWYTLIEFGNDAPWLGSADGVLKLYQVVTGGSIGMDSWDHIAYTFDGTNSKLYVNGDQTGSTEATYTRTGLGMGIGKHEGDSGWLGQIDEIRFYDRALSGDEILGIYRADGKKCDPA